MNEQTESVVAEHDKHELSLGKYIVGFVASIGVTLAAYLLATHESYSRNTIAIMLAALAVVQFAVQMVFFLHIGTERKPHWKFGVMLMMLGVVLILVFGSLWIMNNLNYRMSPQEVQHYLHSQDSL
jgi:cytochrome o ubiquinol oxidase operon protein cyoD